MTGNVSRQPLPRRDSLLAHCVMRAMVERAGGWEKAAKRFEAGELRVNAWLGAKATPKGSRVATFIILWATAMRTEGLDEFSITQYQRYWNEGERKAYRLQKEFRELWPEFETPNELARQLVKHLDAKKPTNIAALPMKLQVTA
jgi:hypothetical protein